MFSRGLEFNAKARNCSAIYDSWIDSAYYQRPGCVIKKLFNSAGVW
jgi:hypothetical protein